MKYRLKVIPKHTNTENPRFAYYSRSTIVFVHLIGHTIHHISLLWRVLHTSFCSFAPVSCNKLFVVQEIMSLVVEETRTTIFVENANWWRKSSRLIVKLQSWLHQIQNHKNWFTNDCGHTELHILHHAKPSQDWRLQNQSLHLGNSSNTILLFGRAINNGQPLPIFCAKSLLDQSSSDSSGQSGLATFFHGALHSQAKHWSAKVKCYVCVILII